MDSKTNERTARLEGEIRSVLSDLLRLEVNDPRLNGVTVSRVRLTADRSRARVLFSIIGEGDRDATARDGFAAAGAFMRRELGRRMRLRVVPTLEFERDTSYEYGDRMERLFERLRSEGRLTVAEDADVEPPEGS